VPEKEPNKTSRPRGSKSGGLSIAAPRGTRDILFEEAASFRYLEAAAHRISALYGFSEIRTPAFESSELFVRLGESTDLVEKEMYTFHDRSGRRLTLRPEGTAPVVRAYLEHGLRSRAQPVKLYYVGPMFRYERPQSGRHRQHHQFGAEILGAEAPDADAEVIFLALDFYCQTGIGRCSLLLNTIGCQRNVLRLLDCKRERCGSFAEEAPKALDHVCDECRDHFERLRTLLGAGGVSYSIDHTLVRGLDYYTRTVFEVVHEELGEQTALGGGGRYDGLAEECGGTPTPAVGFGLGLDRAVLALGGRAPGEACETAPVAFVATAGDRGDIAAASAAVRLVSALREAGVPAERDLAGRGLRAQLKHADRLGARWTLIVGEQELETGTVSLRDMRTGDEARVERHEAVRRVKENGGGMSS